MQIDSFNFAKKALIGWLIAHLVETDTFVCIAEPIEDVRNNLEVLNHTST